MRIPTEHETLAMFFHVGIHVDFFIYDDFFGPLSFHLLV